jgi:hypothetical protein
MLKSPRLPLSIATSPRNDNQFNYPQTQSQNSFNSPINFSSPRNNQNPYDLTNTSQRQNSYNISSQNDYLKSWSIPELTRIVEESNTTSN